MAIAKGTTPNPGGQFADRPFRESLRRALLRPDGKTKAIILDRIATALIAEAMAGSVPAAREIADRIDGKAMQAVELTGKDGGPLGFIHLPPKGE